ncbi:hypothetical protein BamMEX5DRAFT_5277 [Burkholderia ambifaria MEX-5]|uniref:Uncharacterized protein n=1 Tax=Burkholderia ambifaria MEX-5 TaxID=396597 RepID=B1TBW1_9BURK|nr:hypothetical protein BamMEX5DRAFT_5277 [Burkholderia ambifaria MEX-5]
MCTGNRDGVVGAAAVDHDDVVGEGQRVEALREPRGRVEGDESDAESGFCHEIVEKAEKTVSGSIPAHRPAAPSATAVPAWAVQL